MRSMCKPLKQRTVLKPYAVALLNIADGQQS
jgi:hypothetical protein